MTFFGRILPTALVCALPLVLGCNLEEEASCPSLPADQSGAYMSRVADFPVPVRIDAAFSADERIQALQAIATWNAHGRQLIGGDFFEIVADSVNLPEYVNTKDCAAAVGGAANTLVMLRSTRRSAPSRERISSPSNAVGITYRCTLGKQAERQLTVIHAERVDPSQIQSVVLHELGHALGLDHSCELGAGRPDFRSCVGLDLAHPYRLAVMYPTLQVREAGSAHPERKDQPTQNDRERLACRYGSQ